MARSGNIRLAASHGYEGKRANTWVAKIEEKNFFRTHVEVICNGSGQWQVALSIADWQRMGLKRGDEVQLSLKEEDLYVI